MQQGIEFDQELADLWVWLVGGQVEKKEDYCNAKGMDSKIHSTRRIPSKHLLILSCYRT
jgi:hypothetical protein